MTVPEQVGDVAALARRHGLRVGVAESLTSGKLAAALGAGPEASQWFAGGVIAYASDVKFDVLGVTPGPVVTARCAREMAAGAARLLGADAVLATTGVGGPEPDEGRAAGTVYVATLVRGAPTVDLLELEGRPGDVLEETVDRGLAMLLRAITGSVSAPPPPGTVRDAAPAG